MIFAYRHLQRAVRKDDFKLIEYNINGIRTTQLFNLLQDSWEMNDLSQDPDYAEELNKLKKVLEQQQTLLGDSIQML